MRSGFLLLVGVGVPAELEVHAPHVVGLLVQQHALPEEGGVEAGGSNQNQRSVASFSNSGPGSAQVGDDEEAVLEHAALALLPEHRAQRRA